MNTEKTSQTLPHVVRRFARCNAPEHPPVTGSNAEPYVKAGKVYHRCRVCARIARQDHRMRNRRRR